MTKTAWLALIALVAASLARDHETVADASGVWSMSVDLDPGDNVLTFRIGDNDATAKDLLVRLSAVATSRPVATAVPPAATAVPPAATAVPPAATAVPPAVTSVPLLTFADIELSGNGSRVERFTMPESSTAIATLSHRGSSNFAVWTVTAEGAEDDLLVNTIGRYSGTVLFDESGHSAALKVEADGKWTITIQHPSKARAWDLSATLAGKGDDVVRLSPAASGLTTVDVSHSGESNFAIWSYGTEGGNLLVNEIGRYNGQILVPPGTVLLEVAADGAWSATP